MKKPKILILGGAGYVGGYLTDLLEKNGYAPVVYDVILYENRFFKKAPFIFGDVRDKAKLSAIMNTFDIVIALAAIVGDEACDVSPNVTKEVNVESVRWLAHNFNGKIIFASSCSVYGINDGLIDESSKLNPLSVYAKTKVEGEEILLASKNKMHHLIFRFGTVFGVGDEHSRIRLDLAVNAWSAKAAQGETLKVFGGSQWRPLIHVRDISEAILHALQKDICGLYNLTHRNYLMKEVAEEIRKRISEKEVKIEYLDLKFDNVRNYRVAPVRFRDTGWRPKYELKDGIIEVATLLREGRIKNPSDSVYSNAAFLKSRIIS